MAILDGGEFLMGSPESEPDRTPIETQHRRRIARRIAISTTEVTKAQYRVFQQAVQGPDLANSPQLAAYVRTDDSPQTAMTWYEAAAYCNWLSEREGLPSEQWCYEANTQGKYEEGMKVRANYLELVDYRLPTEGEWEFACRGGTTTSRYYGLSETLLPNYGWCVASREEQHLSPVGRLKPNDAGLFDMLGNAQEWCNEAEAPYPPAGADAVDYSPVAAAATDKSLHLLRGGAFTGFPQYARSAFRYWNYPANRIFNYGFRVARTYR
jgi:hypothetical protein